MTIECSVVPFGLEIEDAYIRLFPEAAEAKNRAMLQWRFRDNPHGVGYFAIARDEAEIVGMIALIATRINANGRTVSAAQAVDTIVAPAARGKALFVRMGKAIYDHAERLGIEFLWGFPNALAQRGWFGRLGWTRFGMAPFVVKPLRSSYLLRRIAQPLGALDFPAGAFFGRHPAGSGLVERFGKTSAGLCNRFNQENGATVEFSPEYLNWRLLDCPTANYRVMADYSEDGEMRAMVASVILEKHGARILYLMETMAGSADDRHLRTLLGAELHRARIQGAEICLGWNAGNSHVAQSLRRLWIIPLPEKLRPVEIHFGAKPLTDGLPTELMDGDRWYLSYLNSDTV